MTITDAAGIPDSKLTRVRNLLAKAESTDSPHEAEALRERAFVLMASYGIDQALLASGGDAGEIIHRSVPVPEPYAELTSCWLNNIVAAMGGSGFTEVTSRWVETPKGYKKRYTRTAKLYGHAADLDRAEMVWTSLLVQRANGLAAQEIPAWERHPRQFRQSWAAAFISETVDRIREYESRAVQDAVAEHGPGSELVLMSRSDRAQAVRDKQNPGLRTSKISSRGRGGQYGRDAARNADIGMSRVGGGRRTLPAGN